MSVMVGFRTTVLIFFLNTYFARFCEAEECENSTNRDAWKLLQGLEYSSQLYSTHDSPESHCVNLKRTSLDPDKQTAQLDWIQLFKNGTRLNIEHQAAVKRCPYDLDFDYNFVTLTPGVTHAELVFSDYSTCEVIGFPNSEGVCHMWALNEANDDDIATCRDIMARECSGEIYNVYTEDECSKP